MNGSSSENVYLYYAKDRNLKNVFVSLNDPNRLNEIALEQGHSVKMIYKKDNPSSGWIPFLEAYNFRLNSKVKLNGALIYPLLLDQEKLRIFSSRIESEVIGGEGGFFSAFIYRDSLYLFMAKNLPLYFFGNLSFLRNTKPFKLEGAFQSEPHKICQLKWGYLQGLDYLLKSKIAMNCREQEFFRCAFKFLLSNYDKDDHSVPAFHFLSILFLMCADDGSQSLSFVKHNSGCFAQWENRHGVLEIRSIPDEMYSICLITVGVICGVWPWELPSQENIRMFEFNGVKIIFFVKTKFNPFGEGLEVKWGIA